MNEVECIVGTEEVGQLRADLFWHDETAAPGYWCSLYVGRGDTIYSTGLIPLAARTDCEAWASCRALAAVLAQVWHVEGGPGGVSRQGATPRPPWYKYAYSDRPNSLHVSEQV